MSDTMVRSLINDSIVRNPGRARGLREGDPVIVCSPFITFTVNNFIPNAGFSGAFAARILPAPFSRSVGPDSLRGRGIVVNGPTM